jgi:hypothetical protein
MKIKKWMIKLKHIINGYFNLLLQILNIEPKEIKDLSQKRMEICEKCELIDRVGSKCSLPGSQPCCGSCGCSLKAATKSKDYSCPEKKW